MLRGTLQNGIGRYFIVQNHGSPACRLTLRADKCAEFHFAPLLQDLKKDFHFTLIRKGMEEKVVQDEQIKAAGFLQPLLVLRVVRPLQHDHLFKKLFTVVVAHPVVRTGNNTKSLC